MEKLRQSWKIVKSFLCPKRRTKESFYGSLEENLGFLKTGSAFIEMEKRKKKNIN